MKRNMLLVLATLLIGTAVGPLTPSAQAQRGRRSAALDADAKAALIEALAGQDGEYAARAEYAAILEAFGGTVQPYANILLAEQKHVAALKQQCVKYGVEIPDDSYFGNVEAPEDLLQAALAGVAAEEANIAMYDGLLLKVQKYPSLVQVFTNLRAASLNNHLPAFEAAVLNNGTTSAIGVCGSGQPSGTQDRLHQRLQDGSCLGQ